MLALAKLSPERRTKEDATSTDDCAHPRGYTRRLADGLSSKIHRTFHQRPVTPQVRLYGHVVNVAER